jgi:hypothetical protein
MKMKMKMRMKIFSDDESRIKSGEGRICTMKMTMKMKNDDEDDEDDCPEFDDMMRLAKNTGCRGSVMHDGHGKKNDHDYDLALESLIADGHYTPENS